MKPAKVISLLYCITALLLVSGLTACSDDGGTKHINNLTYDTKDEAQIAFENSTSTCEDPSHCPSYVGSLISFTKKEVFGYYGSKVKFNIGLCSQQLKSSTTVLTNFHCLPKDIRYEGADCKGRIHLKFPKTDTYAAEAIHCSKVLKITKQFSKKINASPDWAILQLEKPATRPPAAVSLDGIPHNTKLLLYPNYYTEKNFTSSNGKTVPIGDGKIRKVNCESTMTTVLSFNYFHSESPLVTATCDYKMIQGNSGSGMFIGDKIVGLSSFALSSDYSKVSSFGKDYFIRNKLIGGTNLHCIPALNANPSPFCEFSDSSEAQLFALLAPFIAAGANKIANDDSIDIQYDNRLAWGNNAKSFYEQFGQSKNYRQARAAVPKIFFDHAYTSYYEKSKILAPTCVMPSAPDNFTVDISQPSPDYTKMKLSDLGEIDLNLKIESHRLIFTKSASNPSVYNINFSRLNDPRKFEYEKIAKKIKSLTQKCNFEGGSSCNDRKSAIGILNDWKKDYDIDDALLSNEDVFIQNEGIKENMTLEVCAP